MEARVAGRNCCRTSAILDVVDRSVKYPAPREHRGSQLIDTSVAAICKVALNALDEMLKESEDFV